MPTTYAKFKFHYDSINSKDALVTQYAELKFKFHYDSINSYSYLLSRHLKPNLNSIMILLIPSGTKKQVVIPTLFKFHYDSINSGASGEV